MIKSKERSDEWYTPEYIFNYLSVVFDMDVAAPVDRKYCHVPALHYLTENGLEANWEGFVWMNPPYGHQRDKNKWLSKFFFHGNGIALMPDRTSAPWWQAAAENSDALLFVAGKIKFVKPDGTTGDQPGNGTCLFASGRKAVQALNHASNKGLGIVLKLK